MAVPYIVKEIEDARIVIAGDGSEMEELASLARDLNVEDHVEFRGSARHDEVPELLRSSKVYVSSALSDGTSNSLLEAMACGVFPVVSNIEANRPWIDDGENGMLVPVDDPRKLSDAVVEALRNDGLRKSAMDINVAMVKKKGNWRDNMKEWEAIYSRLAGGH
jgi:glycosyltransferase involved in cell wall biosynthesis